jgi:hypothetical protein
VTHLGEMTMFLAIGSAAVALFFGPIGAAIGRVISGRTGTRHSAELQELRTRVEQLETGQERMAELEERLDFAERLLAQSEQPARLPGRLDP